MMTILSTEVNLQHKALEIYISGCKQGCHGCHNPEAQEFGRGKSARLWLKENKYKLRTGTFARVWVLGGDILHQPLPESVEFLTSLRHAMPFGMELWLWTGAVETLEDVPNMLRDMADYVKTGAYKAELPATTTSYDNADALACPLTLASSNQRLHDLRKVGAKA